MDKTDFNVILTSPPKTFAEINTKPINDYNELLLQNNIYYCDDAIFYVPNFAPDFLITKEMHVCGVIYYYHKDDEYLLKTFSSRLDKTTFRITEPNHPSLKEKIYYDCTITKEYLDDPNFGTFEIIWSAQEPTYIFVFFDFFFVYWLFQFEDKTPILSGIHIKGYILFFERLGLTMVPNEKLIY